jgi:D-alanyl-D-alanine carboxypeptidase
MSNAMPIRVLALLLVCVTLVSAQPPLPATPAGRVLQAWLAAFNAGDLAALQAFDAKHRPDAPPIAVTQRFRGDSGGFGLVRIERSTPTSLTALLEEQVTRRLARLDLDVTDGATPLVVSSTLRRAVRTTDLRLERLSEAQTIGELTARMADELAADRFSGAVLIGHRGRIVFQRAAGLENRAAKTPVTLDTRFRNGSMNKMFTATAVMQLVEAGKLSLDDTVGKVIPDYPNADVARTVTIRHLLGHTGGTGDFFGPQFTQNRLTLKTHADYVALFGNRPPLHVPGAEFRYSNYGMILLGAIVERVSGLSYFEYVRTKVFEPAGMTATGSLPETDAVPNRAIGYMRRDDAWVPNTDTLPWSGTAAGGGYSTVGDFFRFAEALQSGKLVSEASLKQMITPGPNRQYGFGMSLAGDGAMRSFGHGGGAPGQNGDLRIFPESGYVVVALSNLDPPAASRMMEFVVARLPLAPAATPGAATTVDDFESGTLAGWTVDRRGSGSWFAYRDGRQAPDPKQTNAFMPFTLPNPPQGTFAAVSDAPGPGMQLMYRDIKLEGPVMLELSVFYVSGTDGFSGYSAPFVAPRTLSIDAGPNQQFRVDLIAATAAPDSMADADVRGTVFETRPDAPGRRGPTAIRHDLSPWAGQTIRLRIATAANQAPMRAGVDNVRLVPIER